MRKSIYIDGFSHGANPVPAACLNGPLLTTGAIFGTVRETGKVPADEEEQCRLMFENARRILEAAGASWAQVSKMTFFLHPEASRPLVNKYWVEAFPDEASRPARHVIVTHTLPASMRMQCDLLAWLG
jgi:2-iminobutanoate/2-iminopropanoate deaminase